MLLYKDFVPTVLKRASRGLFVHDDTIEVGDFAGAVRAAGSWIKTSGVQLIQIETVVLPNMWNEGEEGPGDTSLTITEKPPTLWHQFIRVWYMTNEPEPPF